MIIQSENYSVERTREKLPFLTTWDFSSQVSSWSFLGGWEQGSRWLNDCNRDEEQYNSQTKYLNM